MNMNMYELCPSLLDRRRLLGHTSQYWFDLLQITSKDINDHVFQTGQQGIEAMKVEINFFTQSSDCRPYFVQG